MATVIQFRRGLAAEWQSVNPVLAQGEMALELDTNKAKIGNGVLAWNDLPYSGIVGPQGEIGPAGPQGETGPAGPQGPQGPQGVEGAPGVGITLKGSVANEVDLPLSGNSAGDAYIVDADGDLYVWTGTLWDNIGQIVGPQGPQGPQGIQGPIGPQGPQGEPGENAAPPSNDPYSSSWNGVTDVAPSKNAVYDELELAKGRITAVEDAVALQGIAGNISYDNVDSGLAATNVQDAIDEVMSSISSIPSASTVSDAAYSSSWNGVTDVAPSKNAVYDELELAKGRITAVEAFKGIQEVYVDDANGVDAVGRGSFMQPYKTISYAYSQVDSAATDLTKWCREKLLIKVAAGTYAENVVVGFKRARVAIMGDGVFINGTVTCNMLKADHPTITAAALPAPWTNDNARATFELIGVGGGMEGGYTSCNMMVQGEVKMVSEAWANNSSWQSGGVLSHYVFTKNVQLRGGLTSVHDTKGFTGTIGPNMTCEIDSSSIEGGYLGAKPFTAGENMLTAANHVFNIKATNSQLKSTIGPRASILEIDGCRIVNIDRTMGGAVAGTQDNSGITFQDSSSYSGIVNSPFAGSVYKIGRTSTAGTQTIRIDANSYASLISKTIDVGASTIVYNLIDKASGVAVSLVATNYSATSQNAEAHFVGINTKLAALDSHINKTSDAHDASAISVVPSGNLAADDVQEALQELQGDINSINSSISSINSSIGANNGIASLDSVGKIPLSQIPSIAITDVHVVLDIAARDALTVQEGDVAKVLDSGDGSVRTYIRGDSSWIEIEAGGTGAVDSVNGKVGIVSLNTDDVLEGPTNKYFSETAARNAAVSDTAYGSSWATVTDVAPSKKAVYDEIENLLSAETTAESVTYDNTASGLTATNVQDALDEIISNGVVGKSAYEVAVDNGFVGTEPQWLSSLVGPQGEQGEQGEQGLVGSQGLDGKSAYEVAVTQGFLGDVNAWLSSLIGPQGIQGIQGEQGEQGLTGPQGAVGPSGPAGSPGPQGEIGPIGPQGETGPAGPQGIQGPTGPQGETGPVGPQGIQGIQGPAGPQGIQGETGIGIDLKGSVANVIDLPSSGNTNGDAYIVEADGDLYVYDGFNWNSVGQIVGPQGPQGIQGEQGPAGPQGIQGEQGPAGPQGVAGISNFSVNMLIENVQVFKQYVVIQSSPAAGTIQSLKAQLGAGTCLLDILRGSGEVLGSGTINALSETTINISTSIAENDKIYIAIMSASGASDLSFTLKIT